MLQWPNVDLNMWNVSFGGVFLLESGFGFSVRATKIPISVCLRLPKCMHFQKHYAKNKVSIVGTKNPKPLTNRNTPPKLTFRMFRSTFGHCNMLYWLPSDFWRICGSNEKLKYDNLAKYVWLQSYSNDTNSLRFVSW